MIIVQLKGGLGNQLFQYAAGLSLSKYLNVPIKVDVSELNHPDGKIRTLRNYELKHLITPPAVANKQEIDELINQNIFINYFQKLLPSYRRLVYNEKQFRFDKNFFKAGKNIYLKGYRQSEKYFRPFAKDIYTAFQLNPALIISVAGFANQLKNKETVSIHVRRGDYANTTLVDYHGTASKTYYQQAINKITSIIKKPIFYVFSDNIEWVKENLQLGNQVDFISENISKNHYEDFYLMQSCKHNIIANSSFSWWAAWLNSNPDKIVIAPSKWYNQVKFDTRDLIPPEWIKL